MIYEEQVDLWLLGLPEAFREMGFRQTTLLRLSTSGTDSLARLKPLGFVNTREVTEMNKRINTRMNHMNHKINQEERAYRAWNILTKYAHSNKTITYKELGEYLTVHYRTCRYFLDHIQNYCLENKLPPLTIIVVNQKGIVGEGFIAWDTSNYDEGKQQVFDFNWRNQVNPFAYASEGVTEDDLVTDLLTQKVSSKELYTKVKARGIAQSIFRKALLKAYRNRCAFCGFRIEIALEAAHIIPWSKCSDAEKISINNGILLCSNHHKLFDNGILYITPEYRIETEADFTSKIIGKKMKLPIQREYYPSRAYINKRYCKER